MHVLLISIEHCPFKERRKSGKPSSKSVDPQLVFLTFIESEVDISSRPDVRHHLLDLLEWEDESGTNRELKIYNKIAHKWNRIATRLGFEPGKIDSIRRNYPFSDYERVIVVFQEWFENAIDLPNAHRYPKSWQGLIILLKDAELGEVAAELHTALSSPRKNVRKNLYSDFIITHY